jgi:HEPN domain-containing protein
MKLIGLSIMIFLATAIGASTTRCFGQVKPQPPKANTGDYKASAAFAEVRLRRAESEAELEALLAEYTEEYPKVKEIRAFLGFLQKESERLSNAGPGGPERLTLALGKLMVRKAELETEMWKLLETMQPAHPDVKRAKKKIDIYEAAIKDVLG